MKKNELLKAVVTKVAEADIKMSQKDVDAVLGAYADVVRDALTADKEDVVPFIGFGKIVAKHIPAKEGVIQLGDKKGEKWHTDEKDEIAVRLSKSTKTL